LVPPENNRQTLADLGLDKKTSAVAQQLVVADFRFRRPRAA
jgi:hypothetical protein